MVLKAFFEMTPEEVIDEITNPVFVAEAVPDFRQGRNGHR